MSTPAELGTAVQSSVHADVPCSSGNSAGRAPTVQSTVQFGSRCPAMSALQGWSSSRLPARSLIRGLREPCAHGVAERGKSRERADHDGERLDEAMLVVLQQVHALDEAIADPSLEHERGARPIAELLRIAEGVEGHDHGLEEGA